MREQSDRVKKLVRRQFTAVPKAMAGRRTFVAPDSVSGCAVEVVAKGGPVRGFLLQALPNVAQLPDAHGLVEAMPIFGSNSRRDDSVLRCK
jgi:hypothetical protein